MSKKNKLHINQQIEVEAKGGGLHLTPVFIVEELEEAKRYRVRIVGGERTFEIKWSNGHSRWQEVAQ